MGQFSCPWGCAEVSRAKGGSADTWFHGNAWECPKFSQKFLGALQAIAQKLDKGAT
jgi:hypothetical protein